MIVETYSGRNFMVILYNIHKIKHNVPQSSLGEEWGIVHYLGHQLPVLRGIMGHNSVHLLQMSKKSYWLIFNFTMGQCVIYKNFPIFHCEGLNTKITTYIKLYQYFRLKLIEMSYNGHFFLLMIKDIVITYTYPVLWSNIIRGTKIKK